MIVNIYGSCLPGYFVWKRSKYLIQTMAVGIVLLATTGCQTFSLSQEDFRKQQNGRTVDQKTGETVAVVGECGCFIGGILAAVCGR